MKAFDKTEDLGTKNVPRLILSYFFTALMGLVLNSIYNLTDTLFISRGVGDVAMGGVSIVSPFVLFQGAVSTMIGGGAATLVSIELGKKEYEKAGTVTFNAMILFYGIAIATTAFGLIFRDDILSLMGAKGEVFDCAKQYFTIILMGNVFSTGFSSIIRAEGKNIYGMIIWVVPIVLNIILDAVFILVLKWEVRGAAIATISAQILSFLFSIVFFTRFTTQKFTRKKLSATIIGSICKTGLPVLAQISSFSIIIAIVNAVISKIGGSNEVVAFGYIHKTIYYFIAPLMALSQAISPIISYNYTQRNTLRLKTVAKTSLILAISYSLLAIMVAEIIPNYIIKIFTNDSQIIEFGAFGLRLTSISILFMVVPTLLGTTLQSQKKTLRATIVNLLACVVATMLIIVMSKSLGFVGIWIAFSLSYGISSAICLVYVCIESYQLRKATL